MIGRKDGYLDIWDLNENLGSPSHQFLVSATGITTFNLKKSKPHLLTAGDNEGCLHLLNLPGNLYKKVENEDGYFLEFVENEKKRNLYYKTKLKDLENKKNENEKEKIAMQKTTEVIITRTLYIIFK